MNNEQRLENPYPLLRKKIRDFEILQVWDPMSMNALFEKKDSAIKRK